MKPITDQYLQSAGFELVTAKASVYIYEHKVTKLCISQSDDNSPHLAPFVFEWEDGDDKVIETTIENIDHLRELYFALTRQKLL